MGVGIYRGIDYIMKNKREALKKRLWFLSDASPLPFFTNSKGKDRIGLSVNHQAYCLPAQELPEMFDLLKGGFTNLHEE